MNVGHSAHGDVAPRSLVHAGKHFTAGFGWSQMVPVRGVLWLPEKFGEFQMRGRRRERNIALDLLRRAEAGRGGILLIEGEPGIGKSRILRELSDAATRHKFSLVCDAADKPLDQLPGGLSGPRAASWSAQPLLARVLAGMTAGMPASARARPPRRVPPDGCSSWLTTCTAPIRRRSGDWTACSGALSRRRRCGSWPAAR